jgi:endonuclease/exonuclease/phosphatase family metal-dependent hydrolase
MKLKKGFQKILFVCNVIAAVLLLLIYLLQHIYIKGLVVLTLTTPFFIIFNLIFLLYWLVQFNRRFFLSLVVLLLGFGQVFNSFHFFGTAFVEEESAFTVMTYNVMEFDRYDHNQIQAGDLIVDLINKESPDVLCLQEYWFQKFPSFPKHPYSYILDEDTNYPNYQVFYSKFPIVNKGNLKLGHGNNAVFIDFVKNRDTIRVYNVHLESYKVTPTRDQLEYKKSERVLRQMANTMEIHKQQVEHISKHAKASPYPTIISGDFNTTQYSYIYKQLAKGMTSTFNKKGKGFGRTHYFRYFPLQIDHILVDDNFEVKAHKNYSALYSDHYPIMATLRLRDK